MLIGKILFWLVVVLIGAALSLPRIKRGEDEAKQREHDHENKRPRRPMER